MQVPLPCKRLPAVHDKHVVRAPGRHVAHGAVHPVLNTVAVQVEVAVAKVYPAEQAVQVSVVPVIEQVEQPAIPVTTGAGATEPDEHDVQPAAPLTT